jgi:hypothetical protein
LRSQKRAIHALPLFIEIANQYLRDPQLDSRSLPDERVVPPNQLHQATAHSSATQQSDF